MIGLVIPLWGFLAVTVPLVLTPGASTAVVLRNSLAGGTRAGVMTAVGANSGSVCYGLLSAFGFALVLQRWPTAWLALRAGGVVYMSWLGVQSLRRAVSARRPRAAAPEVAPARTVWRSLSEGFATNALNPAVATFYLVLLPQFIPRGAPIIASALLLTAIHVALAATWHVTWAAAGGTLSRVLAAPRSRQILEATTGVALLGLTMKMALG
jgi:threonine/homoserine/homoserine lactone efflux protein